MIYISGNSLQEIKNLVSQVLNFSVFLMTILVISGVVLKITHFPLSGMNLERPFEKPSLYALEETEDLKGGVKSLGPCPCDIPSWLVHYPLKVLEILIPSKIVVELNSVPLLYEALLDLPPPKAWS